MSAARTSRSWSRTRSTDGKGDKADKRKSHDLRRSIDVDRRDRRNDESSSQRFIISDPIAFRYLEDDPSVAVLKTKREIYGYQSYIVEQWATSRSHPTFIITTYTGDASDKITSSVLGIPKDESTWSQRLEVYFRALNHFHARRRDTPDGILMITSLPGFPSSLTVLLVPDGDVSKHYADFFVNEDLKRLGCSGRVGLTLAPPNNATIAKYHQLYRTSDKVQLYSSVIELVRMCQTALHMFAILEMEYVDGLLCDVTEKAIVEWWATIGSEFFSAEPHDGILGPTTVAALLGLLLGARNRLHALNMTVPKDAFDVEGMKRGVSHFQKANKLSRNRRLDRSTLLKLHDLTQKAAAAEGWRLPKAVKTTVAEISGRGEEMLAEGQTRKSKAGIADIETTDIDTLQQLAFGERAKWLWQGKTPKRTSGTTPVDVNFDGLPMSNQLLSRVDTGKTNKRMSDGANRASFEEERQTKEKGGRASLEEARPRAKPQSHRDSAARRVHDALDDGKAGIDRLRDAVHIHRRLPEEDHEEAIDPRAQAPRMEPRSPIKRPSNVRSYTSPVSSPRSLASTQPPTSSQHGPMSPFRTPTYGEVDGSVADRSPERQGSQTRQASLSLHQALQSPQKETGYSPGDAGPELLANESIPNSPMYHGVDLEESLPGPDAADQGIPPSLRRTQSTSAIPLSDPQPPATGLNHRQLSFSVAEPSMFLSADSSLPASTTGNSPDTAASYIAQRFHARHLQHMRSSIARLIATDAAWTTSQVDGLTEILAQADDDHATLQQQYEGPAREAQVLRDMAQAVLRDERELVAEGRRELETLAAKLDYEIAGLRGKIEDVEVGVEDFERSVALAEERVREAEGDGEKGRGWGCVVC